MILKYDKMVAINREKNKKKVQVVKKQLQIMLENEEPITVRAIARATGFSNSFFYRNEEVRNVLIIMRKKNLI